MDQAQIRESPPATDRHPNHWATPPTKLLYCTGLPKKV